MTEIIKAEMKPNAYTRELAELVKAEAELKKAKEKVLAILQEEMEKKNIKKYEDDTLTITYFEPTTRETFDSKAFKEENPDIYDTYVKISDVKASVRVKLK